MANGSPAPERWPVVAMSECVHVLDSKRKPINSNDRSTRTGDVPYYGATGQVGWIDDYIFDEELVLVGEDGAPFFDKSKPIAYTINGKAWVNNHAHVLRARNGTAINGYIKYYLDWFDFSDYVRGSTRDKLTQAALKSIPVVLPPVNEQRRIVCSIDKVEILRTSAGRHCVAAHRLAGRLEQAVLASACSGRLTHDWRVAHADAETVGPAIDRRRANARRSKEDPVDLELPELPSNYVVATVGDAAELIDYGTSEPADATSEGVPVLRMGNIQNGQLNLQELKYRPLDAELERLILRDGDLLFNRTNSPELVGKSAVFHDAKPMSFASYLIRLRFWNDVAEPDFVNYWINSAWGRKWARQAKTDGVSQSNINGSKLAVMPIPLPPIQEQRLIVRRVSDLLATIARLSAHIAEAQSRTDLSRLGILQRAFRGELEIAAAEGGRN
jgi:type I restriction enzyme S subunit